MDNKNKLIQSISMKKRQYRFEKQGFLKVEGTPVWIDIDPKKGDIWVASLENLKTFIYKFNKQNKLENKFFINGFPGVFCLFECGLACVTKNKITVFDYNGNPSFDLLHYEKNVYRDIKFISDLGVFLLANGEQNILESLNFKESKNVTSNFINYAGLKSDKNNNCYLCRFQINKEMIYIMDYYGQWIFILDFKGKIIKKIEFPVKRDGWYGIGIDHLDNIFVLNVENLFKLSPDGKQIFRINLLNLFSCSSNVTPFPVGVCNIRMNQSCQQLLICDFYNKGVWRIGL